MYRETLASETRCVLEKISKQKFIQDFYLVGGTALALFFGHRESIDFDGVALADEREIACMKIDAISSRGSKKDFIDLYFLLEKYELSALLAFFEKKYNHIEYNTLNLLKSLVYFDDAEDDIMPKMLKDVSWNTVKEKILQEVRKCI